MRTWEVRQRGWQDYGSDQFDADVATTQDGELWLMNLVENSDEKQDPDEAEDSEDDRYEIVAIYSVGNWEGFFQIYPKDES